MAASAWAEPAFRLLAEEAQFSKYSVVELEVRTHQGDSRPESLRPNLDTLKVLDRIPPSDGWRQRYAHVEPLVAPSLCAIKRYQETNRTSLGLFRPAEITGFRLAPAEPWPASKAAMADQMDLLDQDLRRLEWVPLEFRYTFRCADHNCPGHDMALRDWEAGESYRKFLRKYGEAGVREKLRERWYERMVTPNRAVHLFVGNIAAHPKTFMLLGLFYPNDRWSRAAFRKACSPCERAAALDRKHRRANSGPPSPAPPAITSRSLSWHADHGAISLQKQPPLGRIWGE
ncbi:hypothetical protein V7793_14370 [Streptomyces sp. KLMMK]|uniref:hypothetical protein n=1 Tax=Streptomyces sp. KLMMK TaxID=3109353 RepID=UPI00300BBC5F